MSQSVNDITVLITYHSQLKDIALHKNMETQSLFMRCRHDVCKFLVEAMHDAQTGKTAGGRAAEDILIEVSNVLGFPDVPSFLSVRLYSLVLSIK